MNKTEEVIQLFRRHKALRRTAAESKISAQKARKILVTAGMYNTPTAIKIREMYSRGYDAETIAAKIGLGVKAVNSYLPYARGMYNRRGDKK
jgi:DNA-directed RNA polymerase specialized sigma24 family protein